MNVRTIQVLLFVAALSLFAADFTVGCGQTYVYGSVTQKFRGSGNNTDYLISVNGTPYAVPIDFWDKVQVGDTVRFAGKQWEVIKPASSTFSTPTPADSTTTPPAGTPSTGAPPAPTPVTP